MPVAENILARNFKVMRPDAVWTSDITYVWTAEGWVYLVVFLDLYSRLVVGWAVSERLETEFVERAFLQGQTRRGGAVSPLVHSDRGSQYASAAFRERLSAWGCAQSMSRKGNCWDNAVAGQQIIIHHKNFSPADNRPENLVFMGDRDHMRYHKSIVERNTHFHSTEFELKRKQAISDKTKTAEGHAYFAARGTNNILPYMANKQEHFKESVADNGERGKQYLQAYNVSEQGRRKSSEVAHLHHTCETCGAVVTGGFGIHNHRRWRHGYNHKVVSVEQIERREDVYCLTVPEYGNFALEAGVFVHNCGMMSARSDVAAEQATPERRLRFNQAVMERVAFGAGGKSYRFGKLSEQEFQSLVRGGAEDYVEKYGASFDRSRAERRIAFRSLIVGKFLGVAKGNRSAA